MRDSSPYDAFDSCHSILIAMPCRKRLCTKSLVMEGDVRSFWFASVFFASAAYSAQATTPRTYTFRALSEHGATSDTAPTLLPLGAVLKITVTVDADAVGTDENNGKLYQGGVACAGTNSSPPIIAVYVNGDTTRNYGGGSCTTLEVTSAGVTMSSADLGIGLTFSANFTAATPLTNYAIPKRLPTATQFTVSTYVIIQPFSSAVSGNWVSP